MESLKSPDIPVTRDMLEKMEDRLCHRITSFELETKAGFKEVDARFDQMDARFEQIDARFDKVDGKFAKVFEEISYFKYLIEDQKANNKYVLDGYALIKSDLEKAEKRVGNLEEYLYGRKQD